MRVTGAAAREQWDAGMVSNNAHVSGVATVACLLGIRVFLVCLLPGFVFAVVHFFSLPSLTVSLSLFPLACLRRLEQGE